jgi:LysR family transcriptional regulator, carnitine catabolism transcriptional activator
MRSISIRKMRLYLAVVEEMSFTRAALKQNISQPAATIIVNQIEEEAGEPLFLRQGGARKAELTPKGRLVAQTFARIINSVDEELARISEIELGRKITKKLLIQTSFAAALDASWLDAVLQMLEAERWIVEEKSRTEIMEQVHARKCDVGLVDGDVDQSRADYVQIASHTLVLLAPAGLEPEVTSDGFVDWENVPEHLYLLTDIAETRLRALQKALSAAGRQAHTLHEVSGIATLSKLLASNPQCAIVPEALVSALDCAQNLQVFDLGVAPIQSPFGFVAPWGSLSRLNLARIRGEMCFGSIDTATA